MKTEPYPARRRIVARERHRAYLALIMAAMLATGVIVALTFTLGLHGGPPSPACPAGQHLVPVPAKWGGTYRVCAGK